MRRRDFVSSTLAGAAVAGLAPAVGRRARSADNCEKNGCGPGFASPAQAIAAPREKLLYAIALYVGTGQEKPDYLATIDADPESKSCGQVIHRLPMTHVGDELHHFGWNTCSSCHGDGAKQRRYLIVPGQRSSRIYVVDTAEPKSPRIEKVIEPDEVKSRADLSAPHTVHCLPTGEVMISMLGDAQGRSPGGFLLLDEKFDVAGRWEQPDAAAAMKFNYDFWYQPRHNVMVSSEWAAPETYYKGFQPADVAAGKYGRRLHFWDWKRRKLAQSVDLGPQGMIPLEVRFHHNPDSTHGFVGAALSSTLWHWHRAKDNWQVDRVVEVPPVKPPGGGDALPALITDLLVSMDDRWLYFSNWLHGDVRQYDISDPARPKLAGQLWLGGLLGKGRRLGDRAIDGGPQMLQLSLDGRRLYLTTSLFSSWDNQFYPQIAKAGSLLLKIDCDPAGGMRLDESFSVDFGKEPDGPARAHEIRYPGGDCTSDIFV